MLKRAGKPRNASCESKMPELNKHLTVLDFFTIGFGAIIGVGWVISVGDWLNIGGGPLAPISAFLISVCLLIPVSMTYGEVTAYMPRAGGASAFVERAFGRHAAFATAWMLVLAYILLCPFELIAIGQLFESIFPNLQLWPLYSVRGYVVYGSTLIVEMLVGLALIYTNYKGVSSAAVLQKILVIVLLMVSITGIIASFFFGKTSNILPLVGSTDMNPNGSFWVGLLGMIAITPFFYSGFDTIPQEVEECRIDTDRSKLGKIVTTTIVASAIFYALIIFAVANAMPWKSSIHLHLPAAEVFNAGLKLPLMKYLILIGALCGLLSTLNSFYIAGARVLLSMGRDNMLPSLFSKIHPRYRTPVTANLVIAIIMLCLSFLGKTMLIPIINVGSFGFIFAWLAVSLSAIRIKAITPSYQSPYHVPVIINYLAAFCCTVLLLLLVIPASPGALNWPDEVVCLAAWILLGFLMLFYSKKHLGGGANDEEAF